MTKCPKCNAKIRVISESDDENDEIYLIYVCTKCDYREDKE